ncbi:MAG: magnesium-translocating P-type ATPase [Rhizobacter sp.]|nr:magnesium-translocating P-type ATPase [Rhizobacter sp.]
MAAVPEPWWVAPPPADGDTGLGSDEAARRLAQTGPNRIDTHPAQSLLVQFLLRFRNPLVLILLGASAISAASGELGNFFIILAMVLLSVTLDFVQEHRADRAAERLRDSVALRATVWRDGQAVALAVDQLVPGDRVSLAAGDRVPADGVLIECDDFFVDQGLLTGESYPVEKKAALPPPEARELQQATNAVFMGTSVVSGSARLRVVNTGARTALGQVAESIVHVPPPTAFEVGMHRFGMLVMRVTVLLVLAVLFINLWLHRPLLESFLFAVALAVGLTPELLPMVVSVTLSRGAMRMAARRVIVKRLASIHNLGAMDVLCTDKTGTLTEARIRLERCVDGAGQPSEQVFRLAYLNSVHESGLRSPLDEAVLAHRTLDVSGWAKLDEVPFDFERRRVSVLVAQGADRRLIVKGAPDDVLALCSTVGRAGEADDGSRGLPLDAPARERLREQCHALEREGLRVLAVAWRPVGAGHDHADLHDESELVFAGFAAFIDPPKESAKAALLALARRGVAVKIVTGDSELVTQHLCGLLGIPVKGVLTGHEIARLDEASLRARVSRVNLFCRVNPAQKNRVILALKARGHVVGYLGDGINDAPSLRSADVGLTVDSGVDVAKEVADMILLDHDLQVLHDGVMEGRRTFSNIMKYVMMGTSSNFGNMVSMAGAAMFLPFLPMLPAQILLNNVLYDLSEVALPLDQVDSEDLRRPRALDMAFIQRFMWFFGLLSSLFDALTFFVLLQVLQAQEAAFRTGWFIESLITQVLVIFVIRTRKPAWKSRPSRLLLGLALAVSALALVLPLSPLARYFAFVMPPPVFFVLLPVMVLGYLLLVEGAKRVFYRRLVRRRARA